MNMPANELTSFGHALDLSPQSFGELRRSNDIAHDASQVRARMAKEGYLYLPGLLDVEEVLAARREITDRLAAGGAIDPGHKPMDAIYGAGGDINVGHGPAVPGSPLFKLLYEGRMMAFYERLFGGPVRHHDFTWLRDVDAFCTNHPDAGLIESGQKQWQDWDGRLSSNPVTLREKLGGRWLTADFKAGDFLTFGMATVHASLDNQSTRLRLSSDSRYQLASEPADERWIGPNPIAHGPAGKKGKVC